MDNQWFACWAKRLRSVFGGGVSTPNPSNLPHRQETGDDGKHSHPFITEEAVLNAFKLAMHRKIITRRDRYGECGWESRSMVECQQHIFEEVGEYFTAPTVEDEQSELVDIAICAMICWVKLKQSQEEP